MAMQTSDTDKDSLFSCCQSAKTGDSGLDAVGMEMRRKRMTTAALASVATLVFVLQTACSLKPAAVSPTIAPGEVIERKPCSYVLQLKNMS